MISVYMGITGRKNIFFESFRLSSPSSRSVSYKREMLQTLHHLCGLWGTLSGAGCSREVSVLPALPHGSPRLPPAHGGRSALRPGALSGSAPWRRPWAVRPAAARHGGGRGGRGERGAAGLPPPLAQPRPPGCELQPLRPAAGALLAAHAAALPRRALLQQPRRVRELPARPAPPARPPRCPRQPRCSRRPRVPPGPARPRPRAHPAPPQPHGERGPRAGGG